MKRCSIWWSAVFAMVLGVTGCGSDEGATGGIGGSGGTAGTGGTGGMGGEGGSGDGDCARICGSPCLEEVLPFGALDDCVRACETSGGFPCTAETIAVLACIEALGCDAGGSSACLDESEAFTSCLGSQ